jgi:hypothetical protein
MERNTIIYSIIVIIVLAVLVWGIVSSFTTKETPPTDNNTDTNFSCYTPCHLNIGDTATTLGCVKSAELLMCTMEERLADICSSKLNCEKTVDSCNLIVEAGFEECMSCVKKCSKTEDSFGCTTKYCGDKSCKEGEIGSLSYKETIDYLVCVDGKWVDDGIPPLQKSPP